MFWGVTIGKPGAALAEGAARLGTVHMSTPARFEPDDIAILWAPFRGTFRSDIYRQIRAAGGRAIIGENGWLSPVQGRKYFQLALHGWNGTGDFPAGDGSRWDSWNVPLRDWRRGGETILVVEQRPKGINLDPRAMPPGWAQSVAPRTSRRVVRRTRFTEAPLDRQLDEAFATLTWTSTVAIKSLIRGIPAFYLRAAHQLRRADAARPRCRQPDLSGPRAGVPPPCLDAMDRGGDPVRRALRAAAVAAA